MLHTRLAAEKLRLFKKKSLSYLPDCIVYDANKSDYLAFWRDLIDAPSKYLYTDGIQVYKVNWFQAKFQAIKGFFGFENNCQPEKIELTLAKIMYYGYIKGFNTDLDLDTFPRTIMSQEFITNCKLRRNNKTSASLQNALMRYYTIHSSAITRLEIPLEHFGQLFLAHKMYPFIPKIDPQSDILIDAVFERLEIEQIILDHTTNSLEHYLGSTQELCTFTKKYANYLVAKNQLTLAAQWSHEVIFLYPKKYIAHYLYENTQYAVGLINKLYASDSASAKQDSLIILKKNYEILETYLSDYPLLNKALAQSYLDDALNEHKQFTITKLLLGNNTKLYLHRINSLNPDVLKNAPSEYYVLKKLWYKDIFNEAIQQKRWSEAKAIYENNSHYEFDNKSVQELCNKYYKIEYNSLANKISNALDDKQTALAEVLAEKRLEIAKQIEKIEPKEKLLDRAHYEHFETLLKLEIIKNPEAKNAAIPVLDALVKGIKECDDHLKLLNKVLLRKIDCWLQKVQVFLTYSTDVYSRRDWLKEHKQDIKSLISSLQEFILANKEAPSEDVKPILAKIYYLKGDAQHYFQGNKQAAIDGIKNASSIMPANIYYKLRHYQLTNDSRRHEEWANLNKNPTLAQEYNLWFEERWCKKKIMAPGFDVHHVKNADSWSGINSDGVLNWFFRG